MSQTCLQSSSEVICSLEANHGLRIMVLEHLMDKVPLPFVRSLLCIVPQAHDDLVWIVGACREILELRHGEFIGRKVALWSESIAWAEYQDEAIAACCHVYVN